MFSPIPGMSSYLEDASEAIKPPTTEGGETSNPFVEDLDNKDEKDPANTEITVNVDIIQDSPYVDESVKEVPEVTPVENIDTPGIEQMRYKGGPINSHVVMTIAEYRSLLKDYTTKFNRSADRVKVLALNLEREVMPGNAGIVDFTKNAVVGLANTFGHFLNLFKTALFVGFRDFKRSELTEYNESNRMTMTRLYASDNHPRLQSCTIPLPRGMMGTYPQALRSIQEFLNVLQMSEKSKEIKAVVSDIYKDLSSGSLGNFNNKVADMNRKLVNPQIKKAYETEAKIFTTKTKDTDVFTAQFANMREYEVCVKDTIDMDREFRMVSSIYSDVEDIDRIIGNIVPLGDQLTKAQLNNLSDMVKQSAVLFEMYANVIQDLNRYNHNLCEVTRTIRSTLNM